MAGLRTLLKQRENVKLFAISVDPPDVSKTFADKIASDGKGAINFPILSDPEHKVIDAYGLRDPAYEGQKVYGIPHPAVYVIDKQGKIVNIIENRDAIDVTGALVACTRLKKG